MNLQFKAVFQDIFYNQNFKKMKYIATQSFNLWVNQDKHVEFLSLFMLYRLIQDGHYQNKIRVIRKYLKNGQITEADERKKKLDGVTFSVICHPEKKRQRQYVLVYTGIVILNINNLTKMQIEEMTLIIKAIPYTLFCFISPSGNGIKIVVATDNRDIKNHKNCYQQVIDFYKQYLKVDIDEQANTITQLCYVSYDPNAYLNNDAELFIYQIKNVNLK